MATQLIFSCICLVIQSVIWWTYKYYKFKSKKVENIFGILIYMLPVVLLFKYHNLLSVIYLLGTLLSDIVISKNVGIGGGLYFLTYVIILVLLRDTLEFNPIIALFSVIEIATVACCIFIKMKPDIITSVAAGIYGVLLIFMLYFGLYHKNIGFIFLVVGDKLLAVKELYKGSEKKLLGVVSNEFFYAGMSFVPLVLINY